MGSVRNALCPKSSLENKNKVTEPTKQEVKIEIPKEPISINQTTTQSYRGMRL